MTMTIRSYPAVNEPIGMVLTADEYDVLPANQLRELVDGVIRIMATPTWAHQYVVRELGHHLDRLGRPVWRAGGPIEVRLGEVHRRNPDVVVVPADAYRRMRSRINPDDVLLAVEVVSPGSETDDRREKPIEYAEAAIPFYWRVELHPRLAIHTFRLAGREYRSTGVFRSGDTIRAEGLEWATLAVADLEE